MNKSEQPFWEESYKRKGKLDTFYGGKPSPDVVLAVSKLNKDSRVLDLGCGEGRNAIYLAQSGFNTTAIDISKSGIAKLKNVAVELGLEIESSVCDMRDFKFSQNYDLIVSHSCLQYIQRDEWKELIKKMKKATTAGGLHVMNIFTDEEPEPEDQKGLMVGLFKKGELVESYKDWKVIEYKPYVIEHTHPNGPTHKHAGESLVAQKLK